MNKRNKGFTLLELVTVISIITILVATGVPSFVNYQRHNAIKIASQDIKSFLTEARSLSLNPRPEDKGKEYYFVTIDSSTISLKVNNTAKPIKAIEFGNDVEVKQGAGDYAFYIPSGEGRFDKKNIELRLKEEKSGEEVFRQTIIVDGIGGDVKVIEG